jgi:hypothetical protein
MGDGDGWRSRFPGGSVVYTAQALQPSKDIEKRETNEQGKEKKKNNRSANKVLRLERKRERSEPGCEWVGGGVLRGGKNVRPL